MPSRTLVAFAGACLLAACNFDQAGLDPPPRTLNFPIAVALSEPPGGGEPRHLFVANSNFDIHYNTGSLQSLDLERVHAIIASDCGGGSVDCVVPLSSDVVVSEVGVGSHVSAIDVSPRGDRIYLSVRSNRNLTFVDVDDGELRCDASIRDPGGSQDEDIPRCGDAFRRGQEGEVASERGLVLSDDPVGVTSGRLEDIGASAGAGDFVLMALRGGGVALFLDRDAGPGRQPELVHIATGFPEQLVNIQLQPGAGVAWLASEGSSALGRVAIALDTGNPTRSFLYDFGDRFVAGIDSGNDVRDLAFIDGGATAFALTRSPEALVTLDVARGGRNPGELGLGDIYEVGNGPSRIAVAEVEGREYVLVSCFDARKIFIIDPAVRALVAVVGGFSGPFEMAVGPHTSGGTTDTFLYVTDFTTSQIRVVSLAPLATAGVPRIVAAIGEPITVETLGSN
ncbi:MAG: hypothetical protein RLO52_41780 [Sandaracinaceae bacterium]